MPPQSAVRRRTTGAPLHHRRVSGPARPRAVPAVALPAPSVFERLRALPDQRVVDRLLRGRLCIWVIGVMLGGIVAMQVSLLRMNAGISRGVMSANTLERQNSDLEASITSLTAGDRVRAAAVRDGMVDPPAGDTRFLHARPATDAARAVKRMKPPSAQAQAVMANGGRLPGAALTGTTATLAGATGAGAPVAASTPTATATPTATPSATATPLPTPVATTVPGTGAAAAPQG
jgi:hypothetical protein